LRDTIHCDVRPRAGLTGGFLTPRKWRARPPPVPHGMSAVLVVPGPMKNKKPAVSGIFRL
jgi:hypothetical protein